VAKGRNHSCSLFKHRGIFFSNEKGVNKEEERGRRHDIKSL
jgi:hypothetical protein